MLVGGGNTKNWALRLKLWNERKAQEKGREGKLSKGKSNLSMEENFPNHARCCVLEELENCRSWSG